MQKRKELADLLARYMPEDTVLLTASRSEGRRILSECAKERLLVGVHAETPLSLAMELCSPLLSEGAGWRLMDEYEAVELVRECLKAPGNTGFFASEQAKSLAAAGMVYTLFQELEMACVTLEGHTPKEQQLEQLRAEYRRRKREQRLLDRSDLYVRALERSAGHCARSHYVALGSYAPRPLERKLIDALTGQQGITVLPMGRPEGTTAPKGALEQAGEVFKPADCLTGRCRFFRCRGTATEVNFVFRDILEQGRSAEDCAVVFLSGEYVPLLQEAAGRFGIPITVSSGVPMNATLLYHALEQTALWPEEDFSAETLCALLEQRVWHLRHNSAGLVHRLRKCGIGWGDRARYELVTRYDDPAAAPEKEILDGWRRFLDLMFAVSAPGDRTLPEQKTDLTELLSACANRMLPGEAAAYRKSVELVGAVTALAPGETLLRRVVQLMGTSTCGASGAAQGSLFCLPMAQALCTGREHLYVIGMSRYAVQGGKTTVLLPDEERQNYPALETQTSREQENLFRFWQMTAQHEGSFTFTYPDFDSSRMLKLLPSPVFETLQTAAGVGQAEVVSYRHATPVTAGDHLLQPGGVTFQSAAGAWEPAQEPAVLAPPKTIKEQLKDFVYSPSSLETALRCPLQFYLQKLLRLYVDKPLRRQENRWLEKNVMGTLCHEVLEHFYEDPNAPTDPDTPEGQQRLEQLLEASWQTVVRQNPPTRRELMQADRETARQMVETAVRWTAQQQRTVLRTEQKFGTDSDTNAPNGLRLQVDGKDFLLCGSIDRMDRLPNGDCAILDYKTGSVRKMEREKELHLQDFLYSLAQETLSGGQFVPREAGYLMLEQQACYISGDRSRDKQTEQTIRALLEWLEDEQRAQQAAPAFQLQPDGTIAPADEQQRKQTYNVCSRYCTLKELCPWNREEVTP